MGSPVDDLPAILRRVWGYDQFRPLQAEAMQAVLSGRDSVVVLPTGGGKSLCFQAPALAMDRLAVVVSPLISLMKDQVDALVEYGVPAACVNSTLSTDERRDVAESVRSGRLKLLYLSPEKLMTDRTLQFLQQMGVAFFAIDEAHCISDWGHDFRPEYRMLRQLKSRFPGVAVHAYTATATARVREDIAVQLQLDRPDVLVGSFDRPNLIYRIERRTDLMRQVRDCIDRHAGDSGIIYCIRRADVESVASELNEAGLSALPYHAGLDDATRRRNQDDFLNDRAKIIVATVAFGMGIDKSDVRYVIHAGAPKSLESYQQESGRAGRDGLDAECCLFYTGADFQTWRKLQSELNPAAYGIAMKVLEGIEHFCTGPKCRHRAIMEYFGQTLEAENCQACDVCLGEVSLVQEPLVIAQKILSCVARLGQSFGGEYTAQVLTGSRDQRILENGHDKLSTWALMTEHGKREVRDWIEQLVGQGFLQKTGEYNVLALTAEGMRLLKGEVTPRLLKPAARSKKEAKVSQASWEGVDRGLFEHLRQLRRRTAEEHNVPPFIIFSDATLRELSRIRPSTQASLLRAHGIGQQKAAAYGEEFLQAITGYCQENGLQQDVFERERDASPPAESRDSTISGARRRAFDLFAAGKSLAEVAEAVGRANSTIRQYLIEFIEQQSISDPSAWLDDALFQQIIAAAKAQDTDRLRPIFDALGGEVPYEQIRIALACLRNMPPAS